MPLRGRRGGYGWAAGVCFVPRAVGENPGVPDGLAEAERDGVGLVVEDPVVEDPVVEDAEDPVVGDAVVGDAVVGDAVVEDPVVEDTAVGRWVGGGTSWCDPLGGLNVATESIAPATRQTARMLASSGMMVPFPPSGAASRRSRLRRRFARSSRW
ncbi:MAG: hypothetical protein ACRDPY_09965 [Streptosporangiaceae bacterium]